MNILAKFEIAIYELAIIKLFSEVAFSTDSQKYNK